MLARSVATVKEFAPECTVEDLAAALMEGAAQAPDAAGASRGADAGRGGAGGSVRLGYLSDEWNFREVMRRSTQSRSSSLSGGRTSPGASRRAVSFRRR